MALLQFRSWYCGQCYYWHLSVCQPASVAGRSANRSMCGSCRRKARNLYTSKVHLLGCCLNLCNVGNRYSHPHSPIKYRVNLGNGFTLQKTIKMISLILLFEIFPCFKSHDVSALNFNLFTCLWITSHSGFPVYILKCSKTY